MQRLLAFLTLALLTALTAVVPLEAQEVPCAACHADAAEHLAATPHGRMSVPCAACHGDGAAHLAAPSAATIRAFTTEPAAEQNVGCVGCHGTVHDSGTNAHAAADVACAACHDIHTQKKSPLMPAGFEKLTPGSSTCLECHQETFAQFAYNERHRLAEGVVECTSCHDPHDPGSGMLLGGFEHSVCADCHADVEGPFVFEHAASRVEGCIACHEPHGSPNRHLLKLQEVGALCYTCHADVPQFHLGFSPVAPARFDESTVCTNCHVTIHGSNLDRLFLR